MAGQIINRGDKVWMVRIFLGRDPETAKRLYHNKKEAEAYLVDALKERNRGHLTQDSQSRTMGTLFDDLLHDYRINDKSLSWAEIVVEKHREQLFGRAE